MSKVFKRYKEISFNHNLFDENTFFFSFVVNVSLQFLKIYEFKPHKKVVYEFKLVVIVFSTKTYFSTTIYKATKCATNITLSKLKVYEKRDGLKIREIALN